MITQLSLNLMKQNRISKLTYGETKALHPNKPDTQINPNNSVNLDPTET